jgi:hypothetical protein
MGQEVDPIRSIFERYNWDYDTYLLLIKHNAFDSIFPINMSSPKFGGLHVKRWGRFGNSVTQLSNLVAIAKNYVVPVIYFEEQHHVFDVARLTETTGVPFIFRPHYTFNVADGLILSGLFYFDFPYKLFTGRERQKVFDDHISRLLPNEFTCGHPLLDDKTITMHFRAGDIFALQIVPSWYGQPPLAYYKVVLDHSSAEKIVIVYEDTGNPTVESFARYVASIGMEVVLQSADLRSDLAILFNSIELVSSTGTFVWSVSTLSKQLQRFWFFERMHDHSLFARSGISINRIHDEVGDYARLVLSANWAKTPEQLGLMLDYPTSALNTTRGEAAAASSLSSFNELLEKTAGDRAPS